MAWFICSGVNPNVALMKHAYQRTTYDGDTKDWSAKNAVDGIIYDGSDVIFTHTKNEGLQWWIVDLESVFTIAEVYVYTRPDQCMSVCSFACLYVLNKDFSL